MTTPFLAVPGGARPGAFTPGDPGPPPAAVVNPGWRAARAGLPGDPVAGDHATQVGQFLATHGITALGAGKQIVSPSGDPGIDWINLSSYDLDQPFTQPSGKTTIGRVCLPISPAGKGADVTVGLYTDSSGNPGTLIASTRLPAPWLAQLAAPNGLAGGGPLATAASNTLLLGAGTTTAWTQPAVSLNGASNWATPVTSGDYTLLLGGYDSTASAPVSTVATIAYLGGQTVSGPVPQAPLPEAVFFGAGAATASCVIYAGGSNATAVIASVWTASWDPATGAVGAWTAQTALPATLAHGGMATWGDTVYVVGGNTTGSAADAVASVWYASAVNGQIQAWTAGPPLPQKVSYQYVAVVGDWLIVAGGLNTSGTALSTVYYSAIRPDGSLAGWQTGPPLPIQVYAYAPGWNLAVTDSAIVIVSGPDASGTSTAALALLFSADGPAPAWQQQTLSVTGDFQVGAYADGNPGEWQVFSLGLTSYTAVPFTPVPLVSVPLPASGLTPGATYHVVLDQEGGGLNDYVQAALNPSALPTAAQTRPAAGGSWTPLGSSYALPVAVWDQTAGGRVLHTWEDAGARITSLVTAAASGRFLGLCEATGFLDGSMLAEVAQVTYSGAVPVGVTQLA